MLIFTAMVLVYALLGFFLAPYLVKKNAIEAVHELYDAELRIEKVSVNPFVFSLQVDGVEMDDPDGNMFVRLEQFVANIQLSSLFNWAATFSEVRFDSPELFLARDNAGELNMAFLASSNGAPSGDEESADEGPPRLILQDFSINAATLHWDDGVPREPVSTIFGPVDIQVLDLSTLPQREGQQEVVITTETTGTFSWSGSLQLNPLRSAGHASIDGSHFPLLSAYIRDAAGYEVVRGNADIELDYDIDTLDGGELKVDIDNFRLEFNDVLLRTFGIEAADGSNLDRDVLEIPGFRIDDGELHYPQQEARVGSVSIDDGQLSLYRDANGELNVLHHQHQTSTDAGEPVVAADSDASAPWALSLDRVDINRIEINFIDESVSPAANLGIERLDVDVANISNTPGARFATELAIATRGGGSVAVNGELGVLPAANADLNLAIEGIALAFFHPYIKSLADVNLDSGAFDMNASLHTGADEVFSLDGDMAIANFLITETDQGSRLGSWDRLAAKDFSLSLSEETLNVAEVQFDRAYGDILIAADGSVNLGRVALGRQTGADESEQDNIEEQGAATPAEPLPLAVTIDRVVVNNAAADFQDLSLPLPFDVKISDLNGDLTTIASESSEPSTATLEGAVDEFGLVRVSGTVTPLQPALNTDLQVDFENVAMPKFSAYSVPFAGREIESGKLDLFLGYKLENKELVGENKIVLRDFELGEKVDHPGASSLPLGLAVALLKDADGTIDIDLPVRGNVGDPEFRYGSVVGKALVNLVVKIAASPFALLGKLVGAEADELEFIEFQNGRADLTPPEQEKVLKLAEALALRPELTLEVRGVVDRAEDGLALRTERVNRGVDAQLEADSSQTQTEILEAMLAQEETLEELEMQFTQDGTFDELAYSAELRRLIIDAETLDETDFISLARRRASNVMAAIIEVNANLETQVAVTEIQEIDTADDEAIRMKVSLIAGEDAG